MFTHSSCIGAKSAIIGILVFLCCSGGWTLLVGRVDVGIWGVLAGGPATPKWGPGAWVELGDVGGMTSLFAGTAGGTLGVPGNDGHFPEHCEGGIIWELPWPPLWRSNPCHCGPSLWNSWLAPVLGWELCVFDEWRMVVNLRSTLKWLLRRRVTIPQWQMELICGFPRWSLSCRGSARNKIRWSLIMVRALFWGKLANLRLYLLCLQWRWVYLSARWTTWLSAHIIVGCDAVIMEVLLSILHLAATVSGMKEAYIPSYCD